MSIHHPRNYQSAVELLAARKARHICAPLCLLLRVKLRATIFIQPFIQISPLYLLIDAAISLARWFPVTSDVLKPAVQCILLYEVVPLQHFNSLVSTKCIQAILEETVDLMLLKNNALYSTTLNNYAGPPASSFLERVNLVLFRLSFVYISKYMFAVIEVYTGNWSSISIYSKWHRHP